MYTKRVLILMNILLTGATGFLGSHVLARLVSGGSKVIILVRKSSDTVRIQDFMDRVTTIVIDEKTIPGLFETYSIDTIIHCATDYGRKQVDPAELLEANLIFPLRLLQAGSRAGVKNFINTDTILDKGVSYYSLSKNQFREWLELYASEMVCVNVALEHFYGPTDDPTKFVSFLINNLVDNVERIDLTAGEQKRNFIYVDDVVEAFLAIICSLSSLSTGYFHFEIGTEQNISIRSFAELVKKLVVATHTDLRFGALPYRQNEIMEALVDTAAIRKLGWKPQTSLEEGLLRTIQAARGGRGQ
jgi:nucleoside-diphosphate-sugar epimerase